MICETLLRLEPLVKAALRDRVIDFTIFMENYRKNNGYVNQEELKAIITQRQLENKSSGPKSYQFR